MTSQLNKSLRTLATLGLAVTAGTQAHAQSIVITQIYGGGGNSGAIYNTDFVELYNNTSTSIDLSTYSLQYGSKASVAAFAVSKLSGTIASGSYFLVKEQTNNPAVGATFTADLDLSGGAANSAAAGGFGIGATGGQLALVSNSTAINSTTNTLPSGDVTSAETANGIVDFVGFAGPSPTTTRYEGLNASAAPSSTTSVFRAINPLGGFLDTNNNNLDFSVSGPTIRNSSTPGVGIAAAPEPSGIVAMLIGMGALGLVAARRRALKAA